MASSTTDSETASLACKLHKQAYIYALYGALDGLSLSYSMIKYGFDLLCIKKSSAASFDMMHDWMLTPTGMLASATESIVFVGFSLIANACSAEEKNKNAFKRYVATVWSYGRDGMKGLKNAYKGVRSTAQIAELFTTPENLRRLILPIGLVLGIVAVVNRVMYRGLDDERLRMDKKSKEYLEKLRGIKLGVVTEKEIMDEVKAQEIFLAQTKLKAYFLQVCGGVVDSLYLYMGVVGLASIGAPAAAFLAVSCTIFAVTCIATRVYEAHVSRQKLYIRSRQLKLALLGKKLEQQLDDLSSTRNDFKEKYEELRNSLKISHGSAALSGLNNGLAVYGVLVSLMFAASAVGALFAVPLPPVVLIGIVSVGLFSLLGFMVHAVIQNYQHVCQHEELTLTEDAVANLTLEEMKEGVKHGLALGSSPELVQSWCEVVRSFFSGVPKGQKSAGYALNSLHELDENGHYRESSMLVAVAAVSSVIYTLGLALRAYAREFGRSDSLDVGNQSAVQDSNTPPDSGSGSASVSFDSPVSRNASVTLSGRFFANSKQENVADASCAWRSYLGLSL